MGYPWHNRTYAIVSGGFDPIHEGHIFNIQEAAKISDGVIAIINSDEWLKRKKGKAFQNHFTRSTIVEGIKDVIKVYVCGVSKVTDFNGVDSYISDDDNTVCAALWKIREDFPNNRLIFCKGGDRIEGNVPEVEVCKELDIDVKYGVGGAKINSSSDLLKNWNK